MPAPPYRLRRTLLGYRRDDVDHALADQQRQVRVLADSLDRVWRDRHAVQAELEQERARFERDLARERERVGRVERRARLRALHIIGRAEKQAARIRRDVETRATYESSRVEELLQVREHLLGELHAKVVALADALEHPDDRIATLPPRRAVRAGNGELASAVSAIAGSRR